MKNLAKNKDSFRAYVCEVCEVNIGRLNMLHTDYRSVNSIRQSLQDLKKAAMTNEYPATV